MRDMWAKNIISFYSPVKGVVEYLVDHVNKMIDLLGRSSKTLRMGEKLLEQCIQGTGISPEISYYDLLLITIVFHDIGKAVYREKTMWALREKKQPYFTGHEIFSAVFLDEITSVLAEEYPDKYSKKIMLPAIYSVLYHHHSMKIESRLYKLEKHLARTLDHGCIRETVKLLEQDMIALKCRSTLLNQMLDHLDIAFTQAAEALRRSPIQRFTRINEDLRKTLASTHDKPLKKLMHLTLTALIALDYEAARQIRCGEPTVFGQMCREWVRHYLM